MVNFESYAANSLLDNLTCLASIGDWDRPHYPEQSLVLSGDELLAPMNMSFWTSAVALTLVAFANGSNVNTMSAHRDVNRHDLFGTWISAPDSKDRLEKIARSRGIFAIELFLDDGNGKGIVYKDKPCGKIILETKFVWHIDESELTIVRANGESLQARILRLTSHDLVLLTDRGLVMHRVRFGNCLVV